MDCPSCGHARFDDGGYCVACGVMLMARCPACSGLSLTGKKFCGDCGAPFTRARASDARRPTPARVREVEAAERTQLTVLFCDLEGSTALSARLDPEELRGVMRSYRACADEIVARHDGVIGRYAGDGVLAYFGYPQRHEDDAEQAVFAGLSLVDAVADLRTAPGARLRARVGIATGLVVAGDVLGLRNAKDGGVFGETPNLAARLQALASPGTVLICDRTRRLAGGQFHYERLRGVELKGFTGTVACSRVRGATGVESRFEAQHDSGVLQLLGRDEELERLLRRWRSAEQGAGRVVVLTGEPGIGKSHIAQALQARLHSSEHATVRYFCSAHHTNSAAFPFIRQLERAADLDREDCAAKKLRRVEGLVAPDRDDRRSTVALLADLLCVPLGAGYQLPEWDARTRRQKTYEVLLNELRRLSERAPVLVLFEDVHWIDPTSLEALALMVDHVPQLRVLLLMTARPEFLPPWPAHAHITSIPLTRLDRENGAALIQQLTGEKSLPLALADEILARTDGVPLFIEELTKTVLESGLLEERKGQYVIRRPIPAVAIPATLQASLQARLDRSASAREVAQVGAAIGRRFSYELIQRVSSLPEKDLGKALDELVESELVYCRGEFPRTCYTFKHALVRDAAYAGLLKSRRAELHAAIAGALERHFPDLIQTEPETLAHHLSEAGLASRAVEYWLLAGINSAARSANQEAIAHLRRGIDGVAALPVDRRRDRLELDLQFALGPCLIATRGPASSQAVATFSRARELCDRLGTPPDYLEVPEYLNVMFWLATAGVVRGELPRALEATARFIDMAQAREDRPALLNALRGHAMVLLFMGEVREARAELQRFLDKLESSSEPDVREAGRAVGQDPRAAGLSLLSWALWLLDEVDAARAAAAEAVRCAGESGHPHTEAYVSYYASVLHALCGETDVAASYAQRCSRLSDEHAFQSWRRLSFAIGGICESLADPAISRLGDVGAALDEHRRSGYRFGLTIPYALLARALLVAGRPEPASEAIEIGLSTATRNGERIFEPELYRHRAAVMRLAATSEADRAARSSLESAIDAARRQGTRTLEIRAKRDLDELASRTPATGRLLAS